MAQSLVGEHNYKNIYTVLMPVSYPVVTIKIYPTKENETNQEPIALTYDNREDVGSADTPAYISSFRVKKISSGSGNIAAGAGTEFNFSLEVPPVLMTDVMLITGWNRVEIRYGSSKDDPLYQVINHCFIEEYSSDFKPYGVHFDIKARSKGFSVGDIYYVKQNDVFKGKTIKELFEDIEKKYPKVKLGFYDENIRLVNEFAENKKNKITKFSVGVDESKTMPKTVIQYVKERIEPNLRFQDKKNKKLINAKDAGIYICVWTYQEMYDFISKSDNFNGLKGFSKNFNIEFNNEKHTVIKKKDLEDCMFFNFFTQKTLEDQQSPHKARFMFNASDVHAESKEEGFLNRIVSWQPGQNSKARKLSDASGQSIIKELSDAKGLAIKICERKNNQDNNSKDKQILYLPANENSKEATEFQMDFLFRTIAKLEYTAVMEVLGCSGFNLQDTVEVLVFDNFHHLIFSSGVYVVLSVEENIDKGIFSSRLEMFKIVSYSDDGSGNVKAENVNQEVFDTSAIKDETNKYNKNK